MAMVIKNYIEKLIKKQIAEYRFVVWYDPDGYYRNMINDMNWGDVPCIKYEGSYYDVRFKAEQHLKEIDRKNLLIYLNVKRDIKNYPLIELEKSGCIVEPNGPVEKNTDLVIVVKEALSGKIEEASINDVCKKIEEKTITIAEIEQIVENVRSIKTETLSIIFGSTDPQSIILSFITNNSQDQRIKEKNNDKDLAEVINRCLGIKLENVNSIQEMREKTVEGIIIVDFLESLKDVSYSKKFDRLMLPSKTIERQSIKKLVAVWKMRADLNEEYKRYSEELQKKYRIDQESFNPETIISVETFPVLENKLIDDLITINADSNLDQKKEIILKRKSMFWAKNHHKYLLLWSILEHCVNLLISIGKSTKDIENKKLDFLDCIQSYIRKSNTQGWYWVDKHYRLMEFKYSNYDIEGILDEKIEAFIIKCRQAYSTFLRLQMERTIPLIKQSLSVKIRDITKQKEIFGLKVMPKLRENKKCAYFLIDSFRYEMGQELFSYIEDCEEKNLSGALAEIPTITSLGMLSLILNKDNIIEINKDVKKTILRVGGTKIANRADRMNYLLKNCTANIEVFKLEDVIKPKKAVKEKIKDAELIVITSQEIDSLCESGDELIVKQFMNNFFREVKRAINKLVELGINTFVLSADHGYLLGTEIGKDDKVDVPNGETYELHKRVWIGNGGDTPENTIRLKASDVGYNAEMDFVFPIGLACFKVTGEENSYFHGGVSLQEIIIPIIELKMKPKSIKEVMPYEKYSIILNKDIISNRIFTIKIDYSIEGIKFSETPIDKPKVRLEVIRDQEIVGQAEAAEYGFNEGTKEIMLEPNKSNVVTIVLNENIKDGMVDIHLHDAKTEMELDKISNIKLKILI